LAILLSFLRKVRIVPEALLGVLFFQEPCHLRILLSRVSKRRSIIK
jgi:Fe-S oxidoreductase